jgi:trans-aconitate 2-methyltransferase
MRIDFLQNSFRLLKWSLYCSILTPLLLVGNGIEDAKTYHGNSTLQWHVAMGAIDSVLWKGTEYVLDIGCGDGKITALLAQKLPEGAVLGIDISQSMIDFASLNYPREDYPNLNFQKLDATEILFENQFDRVVSFSTLHWVMNQEKALKAIHRALIPGGAVCIQTYGTGLMNVTVIGDSLIHTEKWAQLPTELQEEFTEEVIDKIISIAGVSDDGIIHYKTFNLKAFGVK